MEICIDRILDTMTLNIDWYFNRKSIQLPNRIQNYHDFRYVALHILSVSEEDAIDACVTFNVVIF